MRAAIEKKKLKLEEKLQKIELDKIKPIEYEIAKLQALLDTLDTHA